MNPNQKTTFAGSKLESWAFGIIIGLAFLLPVAFLPIQYLQSGMIKGYLTVFAILAVAFLYTFSRIKAKSFEWFGGFLPYAILLGIILVLISSIGSGSFVMSFFGQGYEYSTAGFLILLAILGMISTFIFSRNHARNLTLYAALFLSFVLVALFQIVKLISPASLSFGGILSGATATLIGSWYDLGFFSAVVLILALTAFPRMPLGRSRQIVLAVIALVAVFFLVLIGMPLIWLGLALVFLSLAVVYWATSSGPWTHRLSWWNIGIFIVMALLSWKGNVISAPLITATNATYSELHLPWQMTLDVGTGSLKSAPIVGSGPNTFTKQYLLYKPASINQTDFWSVEFSQGSGFVPTLASTLGLAGIILIIILYTCYIRAGIKSLKLRQSDPLAEYFSRSSFFAAAFLSFIMLSYAPSYAVLVITVLLAGLFIGTEIQNGTISSRIIPFNFKAGFAIPSNILAICLVLIFAVGIIWYGMKAVALTDFAKGAAALSATSTPNTTMAMSDFKRAIALDPLDVYDQAIIQTDLASTSIIISQIQAAGKNAKATTEQSAELNALFADAINRANDAIKRDPLNYSNYLAQANVYSAAASLQITGAYDSAVSAYSNAISVNPYNPGLYLDLAQLAANAGKYDAATQYVGGALQLKNNYTDAVWLLVQVQVAQGNTAQAITSAKFGVQLTPNDPTANFELGLLQYNAGDYADATTTLAKAVQLSPQYANAQYFLGLAYAKINDFADATTQFEALAASNPNNTDVAGILANLKANKSPFANEVPPVSTPEKRLSPPIGDQKTTAVTSKAPASKSSAKAPSTN